MSENIDEAEDIKSDAFDVIDAGWSDNISQYIHIAMRNKIK